MMATEVNSAVGSAGYAIYSAPVLHCYDLVVHGLSNHLIWNCPTQRLVDFYNQHITGNHLEVGVGTGYLLDRCRLPVSTPRLVLMDANPNCLAWTQRRVRRYRPSVVVVNVLEPIPWSGPPFESIGLSYLLHCLPGDMARKSAAFAHLLPLLQPGGVLFGSTLLGRGASQGVLARGLMAVYNRSGIFTNRDDSLAGLEMILSSHFSQHDVTLAGCVALFRAW